MRRVNLEVDGLSVDSLVTASDASRLVLDLTLHIAKVCVAAADNVMKLGPLGRAGLGRVAIVGIGVLYRLFGLDVNELEDERSARDDAAATREEVAADNILKDR